VSREGENYHFEKGGGINTVFGPKYRPPVILLYPDPGDKILTETDKSANIPSAIQDSSLTLYNSSEKFVIFLKNLFRRSVDPDSH
jgi:hypothetical protein